MKLIATTHNMYSAHTHPLHIKLLEKRLRHETIWMRVEVRVRDRAPFVTCPV